MTTQNQRLLACMLASEVVRRMIVGPKIDPRAQLMSAVEEAIEDARRRLRAMETEGRFEAVEYNALNDQLARWELARQRNR